jgi:mannose-6-phosphate isomerase
VQADILELHRRLVGWLRESAFPLWSTRGADHVHGGFHERLDFDARPLSVPRRARLHPRQICAFSHATELGWDGPAASAAAHALQFFLLHHLRDDGLNRAQVSVDGSVVDDRALLYDQAFALFGLARAHALLRDEASFLAARALHRTLKHQLAHPEAGFFETTARSPPLLANSHMHLFEAALAWMEIDQGTAWRELAEDIAALALDKLIDPGSGFVREYFDERWRPVEQGGDIEPGHQFEWGSLLLMWSRLARDRDASEAGLALIAGAERGCVDPVREVAFNSMNVDGTVRDANARLWQQAERLRAACVAFETDRKDEHWRHAASAARTLLRYLDVPVRGLWRDLMNAEGRFVEKSVPASSFYHLVTTIVALNRVVASAAHPN